MASPPSAAPLDLEAIRQRHAAGYPLSVHIEQAFQDATADVAALLTAYSHEHERADIYRLGADEKAAACVRLQAERDRLRSDRDEWRAESLRYFKLYGAAVLQWAEEANELREEVARLRGGLEQLITEWREKSTALRAVGLSLAGHKKAVELAGTTEAMEFCADALALLARDPEAQP